MSATQPQATSTDLERVWASPPTLQGWLGMVNHKAIGKRFLATGLVFFLLGGLFALLARLQLAYPQLEILDAQAYNEVFTMHGVTMAFLFIVPVLEGFAIFILPLMVGTRDLPYPRLTAFGYWVYLMAGVFLFASFLVEVPDGGWYAYVPFTGPDFSPGFGMDFWLLGVTFLEISAIAAGIEIIALLVKNRAPGMTISRMPLFGWAMLVTGFIILFAFPTLIVGSILLEIDRKVGTVFYNPEVGGSAILWQHMFWWFGHPDVYIWLLPGIGAVSMIISTFARTPLVGYTWVVATTIVIGVLSFGVWVHHMFTVGLPLLTISFFGGASLVFAVASGIQVFAWIATLWRGTIVWSTPMLFSIGAVVTFIIGGLSGVTLGVVPFNWLAHDTYYVVAHFHYVVIGGTVLPMFAAAYYWWPKLTGRMLDERLGKWNFWIAIVGLHLTFLPQHIVGFLGMPRRVYTFLPGLGWEPYNLASTVGVLISAVGVLLFVFAAIKSRWAPLAPPDPWGAGTLEWSTDSPVPNANFERLPIVHSRYPLWEQPSLEEGPEDWARRLDTLTQPGHRMREVVTTSEIDGDLQTIITLPQQSQWPWLTSLMITLALVGVLFDAYWLALAGVVATVVCALGWAWPGRDYDPIDER